VIEKSGSWFSFKDSRVGQGRENAKQFLKDNKDVAAEIEAAIRGNAGLVAKAIEAGGAEDDAEAAAGE
jgi:recombination protein RecA